MSWACLTEATTDSMVAGRSRKSVLQGGDVTNDTRQLGELLSRFVSVTEAAELAGVHPATVRRAVDAGELDGARGVARQGGRLVLRASIEAWAAGRSSRAA